MKTKILIPSSLRYKMKWLTHILSDRVENSGNYRDDGNKICVYYERLSLFPSNIFGSLVYSQNPLPRESESLHTLYTHTRDISKYYTFPNQTSSCIMWLCTSPFIPSSKLFFWIPNDIAVKSATHNKHMSIKTSFGNSLLMGCFKTCLLRLYFVACFAATKGIIWCWILI